MAWLAVPAWAQDRFFDVDPLTAPIDGGTANWSDADWKTAADGTAGVNWATNNTAIFAPIVGSPDATTITLSGTQTATAVTFNGAGYTLTGGTLALAGTGGSNWINVNANATIQSALTHLRFKGTGEVTISGGGTSTARGIIGDGTSGLVTVRQTGGTFTIGNNEFFMVGGNSVANSQGAYIMDAGSLTIAQGIYLGWGGAGRTGTFTQNGGTVETQSNVQGLQIGISGGSGSYTLNGGTLISTFGTGGTPYSGSFVFGGGTFRARASTTLYAGVSTSISDGATARIDTNGHTMTWGAPLTGAAAAGLTKTGTGTLQLTANNTYTGTTTVSGGTLQIGSGTAGSVAGAIVNDASLVFDRSSNLTQSGSISGSGSLTKQGAGVLTLSGTNTYAGATTISAGAIAINAVTALPGWNVPGRVSVASGGELRVGLGVPNADLQTIAATTSFASGGALGIDTGAGSRTVSGSLAGTYGITKIGGNTLVLSGANTYTGNTLAAAGIVQAGSGTAFGSGTVSTSGSGGSSGAINLNGFSFSNPFAIGFQSAGPGAVGALLNTNTASTSVLNGNVAIGGENYVGGNGSVTLEGVVSGGVSGNYNFFKEGTGTWRFANAANTFNGFYYQIAGTTEVTKLANLNQPSSLGQPTTTTANRFSFGFNGGGGGTLRFTGADASTSDRVFLLQGATDAASNRIDANGTSAAATLTLTGGISATRSGAYTVALGGTNAGVNAYSGAIANGSGTSVSLLKDGGTTWSLAGANTFTGGTTLAAGRLVLDYSAQNNSKLADAAAVALGTSGGSAVVLELAGGTHTEVVASTALAAPATISRASGTSVIQLGEITRSGSQATLTLGESGVATTNTRNTNGILGGWATVGGTDWAANATDADNGSIVAYTGYTDIDAQGSSITSAATSNVRINAPGSSGAIALAAGTTDINTLLQATATAATVDTASKSLRLGAAGGILVPAGSASVTIGAAAGEGTLTAGGSENTAGTLTATMLAGTTATVNAAITNNGTGIVSLAKAGPGTLTLAGASTFTGGTVVTGGTLALSGGANRLPTAGSVTLNGGSLDTDANTQSVAGLTAAGDGGAVTGTGIFTNSGTYTLAGNAGLSVANPLAGNLYAVGPGTLTISGGLSSTSNRIVAGGGASLVQAAGDVTTTNYMMVGRNNGVAGPATSGSATYTISSGSLTVGEGIYLGWTGGNTGRFIQNGGRVETQQNGQGIHIGIDGGSGTYELNAGTLVTTFASNVSNGGSFTFGGGTLQARGVFTMNQPNVATSIAAGATARIDTNGTTVTWTNTLSGPAAAGLTKSGAGTLVLAANNTYAGTTTVSSGTLQIGSGSTTGSIAGEIVNDALLIFNRSNSLTQSGAIGGSGSLTKQAIGTLILAGTNTYTGPTTVSAGTLLINGDNSVATGAVSVAALATLGGSGTVGGATTISGTHSPGTSPGLQTFTNGLSYASAATLIWELSANTALSADRGTLYDGIDLTTAGALVIDPAASMSLVFNQPLADATPSTVDWNDPFWGSDQQWLIADLSSPVTWDGTLFGALNVGTDSLGAALTAIRPNASFSLANSGGDLVLNYVAVPEPGGWALVAGAAGAMIALRCRRRTKNPC